MTASAVGPIHRLTRPEEQMIYDHLLHWIDVDTPDQMLDRFRALFIEGARYSDTEISDALERVVLSRNAQEEFRYVLNRCCHILINRWQSTSNQLAIPRLVELFDEVSDGYVSQRHRTRSMRRLKELTKQFVETDQYHTLYRLAQVLNQAAENNVNRTLGNLIRRYPYLYEHCLLSEDSTHEHQSTVRHIQTEMQRKFEVDLSQYVTYQVRRAQSEAIARTLSNAAPSRIIHPVDNPTLLSEVQFRKAIKHYVGRVEGNRTYKDLAHSFLAQSKHNRDFRGFKNDLYEYITASIDADYGRRRFNKQLYVYLDSIMPSSDDQQLNDFLMVRTCSQLFNFLVVEGSHTPNHFIFIDLLSNMGPIRTTGVLLKIVLLCRKVKPVLERRFSVLFAHYEEYTHEAVRWLVLALENLNLALSAHFGAIDLSFIR
ncbi:hypothetical protein [Vacuolonema iberomarrocanum]|uniref:hypothetical protein n=1 Tax=Vacuolonema iberomarrocanum TaxID=3454632 RepID=UPI003F6E2656